MKAGEQATIVAMASPRIAMVQLCDGSFQGLPFWLNFAGSSGEYDISSPSWTQTVTAWANKAGEQVTTMAMASQRIAHGNSYVTDIFTVLPYFWSNFAQ
jgi:hypothetical protein